MLKKPLFLIQRSHLFLKLCGIGFSHAVIQEPPIYDQGEGLTRSVSLPLPLPLPEERVDFPVDPTHHFLVNP